MSQAGLLREVTEHLRRCGIAYLVVGSHASGYHGVRRSTLDIDVLIDPAPEALERLIGSLQQGFYISAEAARLALRERGMFNVIRLADAGKVDLIISKRTPFELAQFDRRVQAQVEGVEVDLASAEDTILAKLEWYRIGESERQFQDAVGVARVQGADLDRTYLASWAHQLGLEEQLSRLWQQLDKAPSED